MLRPFKNSFRKYNINFQCIPPHSQRQNSAECSIQTWKHHLIAGLTPCHPNFPSAKWDHFMPQSNIAINILISSRRQLKLSANTSIYRKFDFNRIPLDPLGTKVVIHDTVNQHNSWSTHGIEFFYVVPAIEQYRCHKLYITSTAGVQDFLTLDWFHK